MRRIIVATVAAIAVSLGGVAVAGYADDRAEIQNLSNRYTMALDAGDIETVMSTWSEEGVLDWYFGVENGKAAIRKAISEYSARPANIPEGATSRPRTRHQITNHVIDVDGDRATMIAYWFALTNKTPQGDVQLQYFGHYEDVLVKRDGKWLFTSRKVFNESRDNRAVFYPGLGEKNPRQKK